MPHKKCIFEECKLTASFGFYNGKGTQYCSKHKDPKMINLICKMCECGKSRPVYNLEGLKSRFCKECKTADMINVNDKLCKCGKSRPTFNLEGLKAEFCKECKTTDMINVKDKPCKCGKSTRPNFNYTGLTPEYCSKCKNEDMIDVTHKKCYCGKYQPSFNYHGLIPEFCKGCKKDDMILIRKRLCIKCSSKQATFNFKGLIARFCSSCKDDDMINVMDKCKNIDCTGTGNIKYKYYCTFCFQHLFPNDPLASNIRKKTKEFFVRDFLNMNFNGFIHDKPLWTGNCDCSHRRRIDHRNIIGNTLLCIETDENQHSNYDKSDEVIRYDDVYMLHSGKFIFIRFNPDKFVNSNGITINPSMKNRMCILKEFIYTQIERITNDENMELLEIYYLFYDGYEYNLTA